jgi:hypothetical protein
MNLFTVESNVRSCKIFFVFSDKFSRVCKIMFLKYIGQVLAFSQI